MVEQWPFKPLVAGSNPSTLIEKKPPFPGGFFVFLIDSGAMISYSRYLVSPLKSFKIFIIDPGLSRLSGLGPDGCRGGRRSPACFPGGWIPPQGGLSPPGVPPPSTRALSYGPACASSTNWVSKCQDRVLWIVIPPWPPVSAETLSEQEPSAILYSSSSGKTR
jgi:hypothetical protein